MKLYTEEQVRKAISYARSISADNYENPTIERVLNSLTPIELPSYEEIEEGLFHQSNEYSYGYKDAFNFMRNNKLIKNKLMDERNDYNSIPMQHTQTAIEWLVNSIWKGEPTLHQKVLIEQAKQMEKEQIKRAFEFGIADAYNYIDDEGEEYYNQTYKQKT
jgi:hypothetical protein